MNWKNLPIPYKYAIPLGIGVGLLFGLKTYLIYLYWGELGRYSVQRYLVVPAVNFATWGILLPVVYYFIKKFQVGWANSLRENLMAILVSLFLAIIHEILSNIIYYLPLQVLGISTFKANQFNFILNSFPTAVMGRLVEYWILYPIILAIDYQKKYRNQQLQFAQLKSQLSGAQLSALRLQLQPHFLFNTLNTISSLMELDVKKSQKVVSQLGTLLRVVLDQKMKDRIPLREEIEFIKNYLSIEQVRFHDRLQIKYNIDEKTNNTLVPSLILQPLVENAIKHGFANNTKSGTIEVITKRFHGDVQLIVKDDGKGSNKSSEEILSSGIGLKNVKERLDLIYQDKYQLHLGSAEKEGFEVSIIIPYITQKV